MRIQDIHSEQDDYSQRITATVIWEDNDRPPRDIYFEVDKTYADYLALNPHAFLVACLVPAVYHGEKRILLDDTICPEYATA